MQDLESALRKAIKDSRSTHYAIAKQAGFVPVVLDRFMDGKTITLATAAKVATLLGYGLVKLDPEPIKAKPATESAVKKASKKATAKKAPKRKTGN